MGSPTVTPITETRHAGGFVVWDPSNGQLTRESILLLLGSGICTAGLVLGGVLTSGAAVTAALGTNTGNGTFGAIVVGGAAAIGTYAVEFDDATHFVVSAPNGQEVGHGTAGVAFATGGLGFTITAGATAFVAGDSFTVTVSGTLKCSPYDPTATNGQQNAVAILWSGYRDATLVDKRAIACVRGPLRVNASELTWGANVTTSAQQQAAIAQLKALGILFT